MTRKTLSMLLVAIVAVLSFGSFAEAAGPKKVVRQRAKHSTSSAHRAHPTRSAKKVVTRKHKKHTAAAKKTVVKTKRKPTTKPR